MSDPLPLPDVISAERRREVERFLSTFQDPRRVAIRFSRVLSEGITHEWAESFLFEDDRITPLFEDLVQTLSQSEFLTSTLERDPALLASFRGEDDFARSTGRKIFEREMRRHLSELGPKEDYKQGLVRFKLHEVFRIAVRDITGRAPIEVLARELSDLADHVLEAAYQKAYAETLMSLGVPLAPDGSLAQMALISLGKHGSRELNFSSDLDLIFLYEGEGETRLGPRKEALTKWLDSHPLAKYGRDRGFAARTKKASFERFFTDLATRLIEMISEPGPLGSIYRIDMRLRPEGATGPLVRDLKGALDYYHNWGERWERQALLRARAAGGDKNLGERFVRGIADFIYRKYVDDAEVEETLSEMRELRFRSISQAGTNLDEIARNLKNGPGGIRDVEFMAQAVQILYGAQYPEFQEGSLFEILRRIRQSGLLAEEDYETLSGGYELLRRVEHRIQMDDIQRYHLPRSAEALENLALGLGVENGALLEKQIMGRMRVIHALFQVVFRVEEGEEEERSLLETSTLSAPWEKKLRQIGVSDPQSFFQSLKKLSVASDAPHLNSKLRRLLKAALPRLLRTLQDSPQPDLAFLAFEKLSLASKARSTLFSLAAENPDFLRLLLTLGSAAPYLVDLLVSAPHQIDGLVAATVSTGEETLESLEEAFQGEFQTSLSSQDPLSQLRQFRSELEVRMGGKYVLGVSGIQQAIQEVSHLAEFCLRRCMEEIGFSEIPGLALFALGKFGGRELGFRSDLDLVIFSDAAEKEDIEHANRAASNLSKEMNRRAPEGMLFEVDFRLRPFGKNSPLVTTVESAVAYYENTAQTWERLALVRLRPVCGDSETIDRVENAVGQWVYGSPLNETHLAEIQSMRRRIEREKKSQALKAGRGGLLDIEFIVQTGLLKWGADNEALRSPSTRQAILNLAEAGWLQKEEATLLCDSYLFLRDIKNRLSMMGKPGARGLPKNERDIEHLSRCLNQASRRSDGDDDEAWTPEILKERDRETRDRVRRMFKEFFSERFLD